MFTRRTATVTMSAPEAACAWAMTGCDGYLPVPAIRRDANVRPAITRGVSITSVLPSADEIDDLDAVPLADDNLGEALPLDDEEVVLDGHPPGIDVEPSQQGGDRQRFVDFEPVAVECDYHGSLNAEFASDVVSGAYRALFRQVKVSS